MPTPSATADYEGRELPGNDGGPVRHSFRATAETTFLPAGALIQVQDTEGLEQAVTDLWSHEDKRRAYGERARQVVRDKAGAIRASVELFLGI